MATLFRLALVLLLSSAPALALADTVAHGNSPSLKRADLMAARFEGWTLAKPCCWPISAPEGIQWSPWLPDDEESGRVKETEPLKIEPLHVIRIDETHAALITVSSPVDDDGQVACGHTCDHFIGVVFFEAVEGGWRKARHVDAAAWVAFYPSDDQVKKWNPHGFIVSFTSGSCWQGACTDAVVLLGVSVR